ncbi:MAG: orotidine-5'-phosphate decarboxylase [Bacteroidetes bacterium]|nr:orotidine-5'-phosphate decarboxylase [Bacteroidota bacterium]
MVTYSSFLSSLVDIECIKFGNFTLKSGQQSPIYIDLRELVSYPNLLQDLAILFQEKIPNNIDRVCGVPYAALPMATAISLHNHLPMLIKRKEAKSYGGKKIIEGKFNKGDKIILIEDVITSGISLEETIVELETEGLVIEKILVVLNREQGGVEKLQQKGYNVEALFSMSSLMQVLHQENKIEENVYQSVINFLAASQIVSSKKNEEHFHLPVTHKNHKAQQLLDIAHAKKSSIIASVDLTTTQAILDFLDKIGKNICAAKLHIDIVSDFTEQFITDLKNLSQQHNFMLIEDRKFADIGNTQLLQISKGIHHISSWADFVTIHVIAGEASLKAIEDWNEENKPALIPILEMSSKGALTDAHYIAKCKEFIGKYNCVVGAVCQSTKLDNPLLKFTPGIHLSASGDSKGQQFNTPQFAIEKQHSHFLIIGRGLYEAEHPEIALQNYLSAVQSTGVFG